jgi:hypothetical protein
MTTLLDASNQYAERPADERFNSLEALHEATTFYRTQAREAKDVPYSSLRVQAQEKDVLLVGSANVPSKLTHWSFGQLAQRAGAPAGYLRGLPPTLAAQNINHGLAKRENGEKATLLLHENGGYIVRAFTSDKYTRIWNNDVTSRLIRLSTEHPEWQPAPAGFDGSRGLYASDHDMFVFLVNNNRRIFEKDPNGGLSRGFFGWNSETGARTFGLKTFLYEFVCGNHRVWGASGVHELRVRHVGKADDKAFSGLAAELVKYADSSAADDEAKVVSARSFILGGTKDEVLDKVFGLNTGLTQTIIKDGYDKAVEHEDWYGNPRSAWGLVGGITEVAKEIPFADERTAVEQAAGKVLEVAF